MTLVSVAETFGLRAALAKSVSQPETTGDTAELSCIDLGPESTEVVDRWVAAIVRSIDQQ